MKNAQKKQQVQEKENNMMTSKRMFGNTKNKHNEKNNYKHDYQQNQVRTGKRMNPVRAGQMFLESSNIII